MEKVLAVSGKTVRRGLWKILCGKVRFFTALFFPQKRFSFSLGNVEKTGAKKDRFLRRFPPAFSVAVVDIGFDFLDGFRKGGILFHLLFNLL